MTFTHAFTLLCLFFSNLLIGNIAQEDSYAFRLIEHKEIPHKLYFDFAKTDAVIGGWLQLQKNCFLDSPTPHHQPIDRRLRLYITTLTRDILQLMFMVQGDQDKWNYHYVYADLLKPKYCQVRIGLFKKPFSLEALYSSRYLWMVNRSLGAINYQHLLDIGIAAHGKLFDEQLEYGIGIFNGNGRNLKNNPHKEWCGRIVWRPFLNQCNSPFQFFRCGVSFSACEKLVKLSGTSFSTGSGTSFLSWNGTNTRSRTGRMLLGGDAEWLFGPLAVRGECLFVNWGKVTNQTTSAPFSGYSWYVESSYLLTGEHQPGNAPLFPNNPFTFCSGGGALEVAARYEAFQADHKVVSAGLATGTSYVSGFTLGVNYYLNPFILTRVDWQKNFFHKRIEVKNKSTRDESVLTFRIQGEF